MKTFSSAPEVLDCIAKMRAAHHQELEGVTVAALYAFDSESGDQVLKHQGYPAGAVVKINSLRDRALGLADATIVVDRAMWLFQSALQREALIDHELTHLTRKMDEETGRPQYDAIDRPKLAMRMHDHQLGWFDEVAKRHGEHSPEVRQAKNLMESSRQLYFDFGPAKNVELVSIEEDGVPIDPEDLEAARKAMATGQPGSLAEAREKRKGKRPPAHLS
jgi:hypothetical protein